MDHSDRRRFSTDPPDRDAIDCSPYLDRLAKELALLWEQFFRKIPILQKALEPVAEVQEIVRQLERHIRETAARCEKDLPTLDLQIKLLESTPLSSPTADGYQKQRVTFSILNADTLLVEMLGPSGSLGALLRMFDTLEFLAGKIESQTAAIEKARVHADRDRAQLLHLRTQDPLDRGGGPVSGASQNRKVDQLQERLQRSLDHNEEKVREGEMHVVKHRDAMTRLVKAYCLNWTEPQITGPVSSTTASTALSAATATVRKILEHPLTVTRLAWVPGVVRDLERARRRRHVLRVVPAILGLLVAFTVLGVGFRSWRLANLTAAHPFAQRYMTEAQRERIRSSWIHSKLQDTLRTEMNQADINSANRDLARIFAEFPKIQSRIAGKTVQLSVVAETTEAFRKIYGPQTDMGVEFDPLGGPSLDPFRSPAASSALRSSYNQPVEIADNLLCHGGTARLLIRITFPDGSPFVLTTIGGDLPEVRKALMQQNLCSSLD